MIESTVVICNKAGLHARAASRLVSVTSTFSSSVQVGNEKMVDGKSILSLMMLAAGQGTELQVVVDGEDEEQAMEAIKKLVDNRFDEGE